MAPFVRYEHITATNAVSGIYLKTHGSQMTGVGQSVVHILLLRGMQLKNRPRTILPKNRQNVCRGIFIREILI